ncbi:hypothetical protein HanIR_Chr08g0353921 [Helianthus annuus]|nr:hypothetical protein HanIR_Chr08g0353921 [Helianthus annuus]
MKMLKNKRMHKLARCHKQNLTRVQKNADILETDARFSRSRGSYTYNFVEVKKPRREELG